MFKLFGVGEEEQIETLDTDLSEKLGEETEQGQIAVDVLEGRGKIIIIAPIAGVELDDIDVSLHENILTIKGKREKPDGMYNQDYKVLNSECFWGSFIRNIILPENLEFDQIKASLENNVLIIHIPKLVFSSQNIKIDRVES